MLVSPPERSKTPKPMNLIQDGLVMPVEGRALGPIPHNMERNGIQLCTALEFTARTTRREYKALNCGNTHCSFDMGVRNSRANVDSRVGRNTLEEKHSSEMEEIYVIEEQDPTTQETSCYRAKRRKPPRKTQKLGQRRIRTLRGSEALGIGAYKLVTWMGVVARTGISAIHEMLSLGEGKCSLGICILMFF
ncbi:hypothetical protein Tco_0668053 [Tanacetum coccineum]